MVHGGMSLVLMPGDVPGGRHGKLDFNSGGRWVFFFRGKKNPDKNAAFLAFFVVACFSEKNRQMAVRCGAWAPWTGEKNRVLEP